MIFPIPNKQAETAAKDFASDCREKARLLISLREAIDHNEVSPSELEKFKNETAQLKSMLDTNFYCVETGVQYVVKDYVFSRVYIPPQSLN